MLSPLSRLCWCCVQNADDWKMALRLFGEMRRKGHYANISCYTTLLQCLADHGQASHALQIFRYALGYHHTHRRCPETYTQSHIMAT